jgi:Flp pilus assembly protein TadG
MSLTRSVIRDEGGQALVEFALVLPLLTLLLFAMLDFGKGYNYWNDANHLTAEAARFAVVNRKPDPLSVATLQTQIRLQADTAELRNGGDSSTAAQVCVAFPNGTSNVGDPVRVTMTFTYDFLPLVGFASKEISTSSIMRLEAAPTNYTAGCV